MECTNDALRKYFANNKTDQKGTQSKYSRHIYANPIEWVVYPIFYLGVYEGRFNNVAKGNSFLFPGHNQFKRFSSILKQKPRKNSYLNKVLNQTTSACTV
jgi:ABC-type maltose transport system permease subunit